MKRAIVLAVAVSTLVAAPGWGSPAPDQQGRSKPVYTESIVETARVKMRDGETLFVEIKRPVVPANVRVPVILTLSPYNDLTSPLPPEFGGLTEDDGLAAFYVPRGYARAIADVRGTRESSGCWDYGGELERHDGYDLVEWLGTRAWSNGKVAMIGGSYEGTTANAAAVERPPHLATIVPIAAIDRWYDYAYINGVRWFLNSEATTDEGFDTPAAFDFGLAVPPPIDARAAEWSDAVVDRYTPCDQVEHTLHGYNPQPDYDAFWEARDYRMRAHNVTIPILVGHGLDDFNVKTSGGLEMFRRARGPKRLVIGQWTHGNPTGTAIGEWGNLVWRWFDKWLLGIETGVMREAAVDVEDTAGKWHRAGAWPPGNAATRSLWLGADGGLSAAAPSAAGTTSFLDDPTMSEDRMTTSGADPGRVLFASEPLTREERITGEPQARLRMISDSTSTHIAVVLADVAPDGTAQRISRGFMNPRYRNGLARGEDMVPGEPYTVSFALSPAEHVVAAGHRLMLAVASSNVVWALPDLQRATNSVITGGTDGSRLVIRAAATAAVKGTVLRKPRMEPRSAGGERLPGTGVGGNAAGLVLVSAALASFLVLRRRATRVS